MSLYSVALFVHIVGAVMTFALLTIEGIALRLRLAFAAVGRVLGPISALAILVPGLYMTATSWGWRAWILTGLASYVLIAMGGAVTGITLMRGRITPGTATISWLARVGLALGVVFDMTVKPDALVAVFAVVLAAALGGLLGLARPMEVRSA